MDKEILAKNKLAYRIIAFSLGFSTFLAGWEGELLGAINAVLFQRRAKIGPGFLGGVGLQFLNSTNYTEDPVSLAEFNSITAFIWLFKPIFGFIVDSFPILGSKRTSYILIFSGI